MTEYLYAIGTLDCKLYLGYEITEDGKYKYYLTPYYIGCIVYPTIKKARKYLLNCDYPNKKELGIIKVKSWLS